MIRFDPDKGNAPRGWQLEGSPKKALLIHDDEVWEDYILGGELAEQYPVKNNFGRTIDGFAMVKDKDGANILCAGTDSGGAPATGMLLEMMIASGIEKIVAFGTCGALNQETRRNTIIIPTAGFRDEGLSYHYLPDGDEIAQNPRSVKIMEEVFADLNMPAQTGKIWTTDAIFRETAGKTKMFRELGAIGVDMELASCLAIAEFRGFAKFAQFLIADDNLEDKNWSSRDDALPRNSEKTFNAALEILNQL